MDKNIYTLSNYMDNELESYEICKLNELEMKKMKKSIKRSNKKLAACCAAVLSLTLLGSFFPNQVYAAVKLASYHISSFLGIEKNIDDYITVLNQSQTYEGMTVTLHEVILDDNDLIVSMSLNYDNHESTSFDLLCADPTVFLNGQMPFGYSGGIHQVSDGSFECVGTYHFENISSQEDFDIEILLKDIIIQKENTTASVKGNWNYHFTANGSALASNTTSYFLNQNFTLPDGRKLTFEKLSINDVNQKISCTFEQGSCGLGYDIKLKGEDSLGNPVEFLLNTADSNTAILKILSIENGYLNSDADFITLTPYAAEWPKESGKSNDNFEKIGEPFQINLHNKQ